MKNFSGKETDQPLLWGLLHGMNDLAAGYMLANFSFHHDHSESFTMLVIYAIIGFGGQLPVGLLLDKLKEVRPFAVISISLLILSVVLYSVDPFVAIIVTGFAGAGIHVTGGAICVQVEERAGPLGIFTAPGVLGLTLGGLSGSFAPSFLLICIPVILILAVLTLRQRIPVYQARHKKENSQLDTHDFIMLGILLIMCFRSFIFDVINGLAFNFEQGILVLGISAFLGKIIGGFVADRIGWKKFIYITLSIAFVLLHFGKDNIYALGFGIACLQSSVPLTLLFMCRSLPLYPATATSLSLGTSVALAGLPLYMGGEVKAGTGNHIIWILVFLGMMITWLFVIYYRKKHYRILPR